MEQQFGELSIGLEYGDDDFDNFDKEDFLSRVVRDCNNADAISLDELAEHMREDVKWIVHGRIEQYHPEGCRRTWQERREWIKSDEFKRLLEEATEKELDKIVNRIRRSGLTYFVEVEYADEDGPFEIIPNLKCCKQEFSHH